jgi:hypothetical protein
MSWLRHAASPATEPPTYGPQPAETPHPVLHGLNPLNWGCASNHNTMGCGSLRSEITFIFGSCRAFYGEPCFKDPAVPPLPPGAAGAAGAAGAGQGSDCRCR